MDQNRFLALVIVDQPILPLAGFAFSRPDRGVERSVAGEAAVHRDHFFLGHVQLGGDLGHLVRLQIAFLDGLDLALEAAQVEEQPLLVGGRAHLDQRPRAQDVFLDRGLDPPHGIGRQTEAAFRVEFLDGLHQTDIAFRHDFADRQAVAAIAHGDLCNETQVARHHLVGGRAVAMLSVTLREHVFLLWLQHREFADFVEIAIETGFAGGNGRQIVTGHEAPLSDRCRFPADFICPYGEPIMARIVPDPAPMQVSDKCGGTAIQAFTPTL